MRHSQISSSMADVKDGKIKACNKIKDCKFASTDDGLKLCGNPPEDPKISRFVTWVSCFTFYMEMW